jgi:hypothetical protein
MELEFTRVFVSKRLTPGPPRRGLADWGAWSNRQGVAGYCANEKRRHAVGQSSFFKAGSLAQLSSDHVLKGLLTHGKRHFRSGQ